MVLLAAAAMTLVLPVCITAVTIDANGAIWQGRYFLPFVVGILILCGTVIDDGDHPSKRWLQVVVVLLLAVAQGWSVWRVAADEARRAATHLGPDWVTLPPAGTRRARGCGLDDTGGHSTADVGNSGIEPRRLTRSRGSVGSERCSRGTRAGQRTMSRTPNDRSPA